jgi:acyl-CoA synthetase (AMP-forming)/AMP-acid ligase II
MAAAISEEYGGPVPEILPTCWERFHSLVENYPEDLALVSMHHASKLYSIPNLDYDDEAYNEQPYLRWNYHGLGTAVDEFAAGLLAFGVRKGMPLITFLANGAEHMIAAFAANKIGCPFTPISPKNFVNMEETVHMVEVCKINGTADRVVYIA